LIAGTAWYCRGARHARKHSHVSVPELTHIQAGRTASLQRTAEDSWSTIIRSKEVLALTLSYFSFGLCRLDFFSWFFIYLAKVRG